MLSSSFLLNVAAGYMEGTAERRKNEREAELQREKDAAELDRQFAKSVADAINSKNFRPESIPLLYKAYGKEGEYDPKKYAALANLVGEVGDTHKVGTHAWNFSVDTNDPRDSSENYLMGYNTALGNPSYYASTLDHYVRKDRDGGMQMIKNIDMYGQNFLFNNYKTNSKDQSAITRPGEFFPELYKFRNELASALNLGQHDDLTATVDTLVNDGAIQGNEIFVGTMAETRANGQVAQVPKKIELTDNELQNANAFQQKFFPDKTVHHLFNRHESLHYNDNRGMQIKSMKHATNLYVMGVGEFQKTTTDPNTMRAVTNYLMKVGGEDVDQDAMIAAVYPIYAADLKKFPVGQEWLQDNEIQSGADYVRKEYGEKRYTEITNGFRSTDLAVKLGTELFDKREELGKSGVARAIFSSLQGLTSPTGQISQLTSQVVSQEGGLADDFDQSRFDSAYAKFAQSKGYDLSKTLGEIETLEFNLAVAIARSADPAGRLSNQDFENALRTIGTGGLLTSLAQSQGSLATTIRIAEEKRNKLSYMYKVTQDQTFDRRDRIALAVHQEVIRPVIDFNRQIKNTTSKNKNQDPSPKPKVDPSSFTADTDITSQFKVPEGTRVHQIPGGKAYLVTGSESVEITGDNMPPLAETAGSGKGPAAPVEKKEDDAGLPAPPPEPKSEENTASLISPSMFAGQKQISVGEGLFKFGDDPTTYKVITEKNANGKLVIKGYEAQ